MIILGIDTSCDDTCAALVEDGRKLLSNIVTSQAIIHHRYGGVVPELASREHIRNIVPAVREALKKARLNNKDIDAVAVTMGPGLVGALLVGINFAKAYSYANRIPLIGVNHLEGHILSVFLEERAPLLPFVALTVSGGHTNIYHVRDFGDYTVLGQTLDDAAGEAFDKTAKLLELGYPGGGVIEKLAATGRPDVINFPKAYISKDSLDFSFSGLKTAVALYVKKWRENKTADNDIRIEDITSSFQAAVVDILTEKVISAADQVGVKSVVLAGGVARNNHLRSKLREMAAKKGIDIFIPRPELCTDNGAMIAVAGYHGLIRGRKDDLTLDARSRFLLGKHS
ncbi:MAG TPA: tRNA (adenosine(37)-N6)-threonylcarbamoyltransferase complex transferase subunit TsaD [Desulfatiglandales bacterium]|nr:tRNA (adenosine(37)-N6)-threonylcarbamoyltransferase complex transferase subunit TsaD [Desulfatiglandales bacterium]